MTTRELKISDGGFENGSFYTSSLKVNSQGVFDFQYKSRPVIQRAQCNNTEMSLSPHGIFVSSLPLKKNYARREPLYHRE